MLEGAAYFADPSRFLLKGYRGKVVAKKVLTERHEVRNIARSE